MTTFETEVYITGATESRTSLADSFDLAELIAEGKLELSEGQIGMLAYMTSLGEDVAFARRHVLPYGEGTHGEREREFSALVGKIIETPGLGDRFQSTGEKSQREYWFARPGVNSKSERQKKEAVSHEEEQDQDTDQANTREYTSNLAWMARAVCKDVDPNTFFPHYGADVEIAQRICAQCVVKEDCLEFALVNRIDHGVWGGASEQERKRILKSRRAAA